MKGVILFGLLCAICGVKIVISENTVDEEVSDLLLDQVVNGENSRFSDENVETEKRADVKDQSSEISQLRQLLEEKDAQIAGIMKQIEAIIRQERETLKLVNGLMPKSQAWDEEISAYSADEVKTITTGGIHYILWGKNECPETAVPLYRGYTASNHYAHNWGGANTLCLHERPQWANSATDGSYIYGAEYGFVNTPFSAANVAGNNLQYQDVPCTVCHAPTRSNQLMIPGRRQCPTGWTLEYRGYVVSTLVHGHVVKGEYICLDESPEVRIGGAGQTNGLVLNSVFVHCGSIPCPNYFQKMTLTCVVCTK